MANYFTSCYIYTVPTVDYYNTFKYKYNNYDHKIIFKLFKKIVKLIRILMFFY